MRVGDEKLIIISVTVRGINVRIRFYSQTLCTAAINTEQDHSGTLARDHTIRYDTRCYFNVRSKADMSQLNLPHGNDN